MLEWEFGLPWEDEQKYDRWSPDKHVKRWKTPTFVIHGGKDFRVPETEGIATFTALQRRGIPSRFLYFADECHWVLKPHNSLQWYKEVFAWLREWLEE
jgi:dipeptidyl aminopeptidase/acylaminoacyl peptidase